MPVAIDPFLSTLSVVVAVFGVMSAVALATQAKDANLPSGHAHLALINGALTIGIVVWGTHFIATRAVGFPISGSNDAVEIAGLIAFAVLASWAGFSLAAARGLGAFGGLIGGVVIGIGVIGLHYRPIWYAAACGADCNSELMLGLVSVVIVAAAVAIWMAFQRLSAWRGVVSGLVLGIAVAVMSYGAMIGTYAARATTATDWSIPLLELPAPYAIASGIAVLAFGNLALLVQITKHRLTREHVERVQWTYHKVEDAGVEVADLFYDRLFEIAPQTRSLFPADMSQQKDKLLDVLASAVLHLHKLDSVMPVIRDLGRRHVYYGVKPEHYQPVGDALIWTLERVLGDDFTPATKKAWIAAYKTLSGAMLEAAKEVHPPVRRRIREAVPAAPSV